MLYTRPSWWNKIANGALKAAGFVTGLARSEVNNKEYFTLVVIPPVPARSFKFISVSRFFVIHLVLFNFIMLTSVFICGFSYHSMSTALKEIESEYNALQAVKECNENQLQIYRSYENELRKKMLVLNGLGNSLNTLIESKGGKPEYTIYGNLSEIPNGVVGFGTPQDHFTYSKIHSLQSPVHMCGIVDEMVEHLDRSIKELNDAVIMAENQIRAMQSKPSILPVYGHISSVFGYRVFRGRYEFHGGIDIANAYGTPIRASADGIVTIAGWEGGYGNLVKIDHGNGYESLYGHNSKIAVQAGQNVKRGQILAYMGSTGRSTGNHCHFEVRLYNNTVNPYNIK